MSESALAASSEGRPPYSPRRSAKAALLQGPVPAPVRGRVRLRRAGSTRACGDAQRRCARPQRRACARRRSCAAPPPSWRPSSTHLALSRVERHAASVEARPVQRPSGCGSAPAQLSAAAASSCSGKMQRRQAGSKTADARRVLSFWPSNARSVRCLDVAAHAAGRQGAVTEQHAPTTSLLAGALRLPRAGTLPGLAYKTSSRQPVSRASPSHHLHPTKPPHPILSPSCLYVVADCCTRASPSSHPAHAQANALDAAAVNSGELSVADSA
jgi:hypothetical protein